MNPDSPQTPREELEARLTALLLGELSAEDAAALRQAIDQDAELARLHERLRHAVDLVREVAAEPAAPAAAQAAPLRLSDERRQQLLAHFKTVTPKEFARPTRRSRSWLVPLAAAAAIVLLLGVMVMPRFAGTTERERLAALSHRFDLAGSASELKPHFTERLNRRPAVAPPPTAVSPAASPTDRPEGGYSLNVVGNMKVKENKDLKETVTVTDSGVAASQSGERFARSSGIVLPTAGKPADGKSAPVLGDVPMLGAAFRRASAQRVRDESGLAQDQAQRNLKGVGDIATRPASAQPADRGALFHNTVLAPAASPSPAKSASSSIVLPAGEPAVVSQSAAAATETWLRNENGGAIVRGFYDDNWDFSGGAVSAGSDKNRFQLGLGETRPADQEQFESERQSSREFVGGRGGVGGGGSGGGEAGGMGGGVGRVATPASAAVSPPTVVANGTLDAVVDDLNGRGISPVKSDDEFRRTKDVMYFWGDRTASPDGAKAGFNLNAVKLNGVQAEHEYEKFALADSDFDRSQGSRFLSRESGQPAQQQGGSVFYRAKNEMTDADQTLSAGNNLFRADFTDAAELAQTLTSRTPAQPGASPAAPNNSQYGKALAARPENMMNLGGQAPSTLTVGGGSGRGGASGPQISDSYIERNSLLDARNSFNERAGGNTIAAGDGTASRSRIVLPSGTVDEPLREGVSALDPIVGSGPLRGTTGNALAPASFANDLEAKKPSFGITDYAYKNRQELADAGRTWEKLAQEGLEQAGETRNDLVKRERSQFSADTMKIGEVANAGDVVNSGAITDIAGKTLNLEIAKRKGVTDGEDSLSVQRQTGDRALGFEWFLGNAGMSSRQRESADEGVPKVANGSAMQIAKLRTTPAGGPRNLGESELGTTVDRQAGLQPLPIQPSQPTLKDAPTEMPIRTITGVESSAKMRRLATPIAAAPEKARAQEELRRLQNEANNQQADVNPPKPKGPATNVPPPLTNLVTQIVPLKNVNASSLIQTISALLPPDNQPILTVNAGANAIVIRDAQTHIRRMVEIVRALDTPTNFVAQAYPLQYAKASDVAQQIKALYPAPTGGAPPVVVVADERSNTLIVRGARELLGKLTEVVAKADDGPAERIVRRPSPEAPIPQPEIQTGDNAFSTFSLNVSDVAFKLAAASLEKGVMPEPATVRSEEFINAFDYRDPEPAAGVPIGFVWERARYPFAHNRDLLRFSVKTAALGRQPGRPLNLVLLLDNSGSMERADRVRILREALRVLAAQLQPQDTFSIVTFARTARLWVDGVPGSQAAAVAEQAGRLTPEGGTNLEEALNAAYQTALRHYLANGVNRVVLLTDGAANLGNVDPAVLKLKVEALRKQGVALDAFGIGWEGYNDDLLEVLSRNGDGRYGFINSPEEAASEFAGQLAGALRVAASDVKVQVEFNPRRVTTYRQIGYAKHQLTKEQFRDNTVDAAEIGAAETGNGLYTVEVNPAGDGPLCTVRVRFRVPGTADYREHAWDVPFNGNALALEQASPAMRLAATASAFSEWLVASPFAAEVTPDRLLGLLSGVPEVFGADARPKKLEWMIRQGKSVAGK